MNIEEQYPQVPLGQAHNLSGQVFGHLIALYRTKHPAKQAGTFWLCRCSCELDRYVVVSSGHLVSGHTQSCGCMGREKLVIGQQGINIAGQTFGRLTAIRPTKERKSGAVVWEFKCSCDDKLCYFPGTLVKNGYIQSCGCYQKEVHRQDLTGKIFGKLTAKRPTKERSERDRSIIWLCDCKCGTQDYPVSVSDLTQGRKCSCGCLAFSKGELAIADLLIEANIPFTTEQKFDTCLLSDHPNSFAKFDFFVNNKYLIEFDGVQHFKYSETGWDTKEKFELTQERDCKKNQWCKEHNIPLIRIPYTHLKELKLDDLLLETSQFIV